ncbi:pilus assembly protein Flp/PilA [Paraburkholderia sp. WC7.3g]|uniref:Flp family type IVb pilin n=1 Tax=Paraburkholderia podalyriae TaxID=1938811 RepID=A0ABR7PKR7_9BURK|nr:Flp family type IVb pilin [Paraburkholderia podalyriae]MBC8746967.1 Flp family type IVb pilin [Paraburkholderia podalyriae]
MLRFIRSLSRDERGVSSLEYAVLGGIIVAVLVALGTFLSGTTGFQAVFQKLLTNATNAI